MIALLAFFSPPADPADAGIAAVAMQLASRWTLILLAFGVTFVAFLVNRYAPKKRRRVRRVVIIFGLYVLAFGAAAALRAGGMHTWGARIHLVADLLEAFTVVNMVALAIFDIVLPALRVDLVTITSDLLVGVAYIVSTLVVLRSADVNPSSIVATSAIVSGVLALSLQATLGNILGGVALQLDGSIHVGDWVQLDSGKQGKVREIRWRHTVLETRDWDTVIVPNAALLASNITILGKREGAASLHRMWVYFNVDFRFAPARVIAVVNEALQSAPLERVASEPKPHAICMDFAKDNRDSFAYYAVRYWLTDLAVDDPTSSLIRTRIYSALKRANIPLARPTSTIFLTPDGEAAEASRLARHHDQRLKMIRSLDLFRTLTEEERAFVADHLHYSPFTAGETMTRQGAVAHWLYILLAGTAEVRTSVDGAPPKVVATLEGPDFFGEMGLMTGEPRMADVVACTDVDCYRLEKGGFQKIIEERPEIAHEMSNHLARRRVELIAVRDGLDAEAKRLREAQEQVRILEKIQGFFGLGK